MFRDVNEIPLDVWCRILNFSDSRVIYMNVILSIKGLYEVIRNQNYFAVENITFRPICEPQTPQAAQNLIVCRKWDSKVSEENCEWMKKKFPYLVNLEIDMAVDFNFRTMGDFKMLKSLKLIQTLPNEHQKLEFSPKSMLPKGIERIAVSGRAPQSFIDMFYRSLLEKHCRCLKEISLITTKFCQARENEEDWDIVKLEKSINEYSNSLQSLELSIFQTKPPKEKFLKNLTGPFVKLQSLKATCFDRDLGNSKLLRVVFPILKELSFSGFDNISDEDLVPFGSTLEILKISNYGINGYEIDELKNLRVLELDMCDEFVVQNIEYIPSKLKRFVWNFHEGQREYLNDWEFSTALFLENLEELELAYVQALQGDCGWPKRLHHLKVLKLKYFVGFNFKLLPLVVCERLIELEVWDSYGIQDANVMKMKILKKLVLKSCPNIHTKGFEELENLKILEFEGCEKVSEKRISELRLKLKDSQISYKAEFMW